MARAQRTAADPAAVYHGHAEEARQHQQLALTDEGRTHLDHAQAWHQTAARITQRAARLRQTVTALRAIAGQHRAARRNGTAEHIERLATKLEAAASFAPQRAQHFHAMGLARHVQAFDHEPHLAPPKAEEPEEEPVVAAVPAPVDPVIEAATEALEPRLSSFSRRVKE